MNFAVLTGMLHMWSGDGFYSRLLKPCVARVLRSTATLKSQFIAVSTIGRRYTNQIKWYDITITA